MGRHFVVAAVIALTLLGGLPPRDASASASGVVISEFRFRGPLGGNDEFVELLNAGTGPVDISGWKLQGCASTTGNASDRATVPTGIVLPPGANFLFTNSGTNGYSGTVPGNVTYSIGMSDGAGARIVTASGAVVDGVSGTLTTASQCREGAGIAGMPTTNGDRSYERRSAGTQDTDDNAADFDGPKAGDPRRWDPPTDAAPAVVFRDPASGASGIPRNGSVTIGFSEPVELLGTWYDITCATSGAHAATVSSGGTNVYVLDPVADFANTETCTVTVFASQVRDLDTADPPDHMAADDVFTFQTADEFRCGDPATRIHAVQGSGTSTPMSGATVTVEGVVVGDYQKASPVEFGGFFLQEEDADADADPLTSEGIFVFRNEATQNVIAGDVVRVRGRASEFSSLTQISSITQMVVCSSGASVTATGVSLPVAAVSDLERYEGMLVSIAQHLTVTEVFNLGRFGEVMLSASGRQYTPTAVAEPGAAAAAVADLNRRSRIILDDGNNQQNIDPTRYPQGGLSASNTLRVGDSVNGVTGVLDFRFSAYRIQPVGAIAFDHTNPRPAAPTAVGGTLRVASFNVLNFFNGDGLGGGFPTARGAETPFELGRQRAKIVSALTAMSADIVGLMEIENDAGANSALADLVAALNAALGAGTYAYIDTGVIGTDAIKVALIYKPAAVRPIGAYQTIDSADDPRFIDTLNRPSLAQTFEHLGSAQRLTVVVNHLKSKGSACPGDPDAGDGQGNCNGTRTAAARALVDWLATDPTGSGDADVLIIGDLNAYTREDPIDVLTGGGFTDLVAAYGGGTAYSYVFQGESGYLDHALATSALAGHVTGATEWHINPDEPAVLDYNVNFKSANHQTTLYDAGPYRSSDHDPVIVGLDLRVTVSSLAVLTSEVVTSDDVRDGLLDKLAAAEAALARGSTRAAANQIAAYVNQVRAQSGKAISESDAARLIALAGQL